MHALFETTTLNGVPLKNRFVRSAIWEGLATDDGRVTPALVAKMSELAANAVGLIISGHAYVSPEGQAGPWQLGAYSDDLLPGLQQMAEAVRQADGRIFLQLAHAGAHAATAITGRPAIGPSPTKGRSGDICREMTSEEIRRVVKDMQNAAVRAQKAGFDGVQIHAAHGYLLSQFLSPLTNRREDAYGGSIENRARIVIEVLRAIRAAVGDAFAVTIKINSADFTEGGMQSEQMLQTAALLQDEGLDALEMSGGTVLNPKETHCARKENPKTPEQEVYYRQSARQFKQQIKLPLMLVGGIRSWEVAESLVSDGIADFIAFGRPLIAEPDLIKRWQAGDRARSTCISCNKCYEPILAGEGVSCPVAEKRRAKAARKKR